MQSLQRLNAGRKGKAASLRRSSKAPARCLQARALSMPAVSIQGLMQLPLSHWLVSSGAVNGQCQDLNECAVGTVRRAAALCVTPWLLLDHYSSKTGGPSDSLAIVQHGITQPGFFRFPNMPRWWYDLKSKLH
eukprot:766248-Hanusia_phi.AAC.9